ncbi:hypothetical protein [Nocardia transvalensis]|uniref:hypothetical protein n=1 Tax=Nocardia transvalensis TaxID=37333 RepID=UPI0018956D6F|nr:hypothetical protein [Nocardia transvalensis]MBF6328199.1 hypothetical protein [Nocardia transvalensis]
MKWQTVPVLAALAVGGAVGVTALAGAMQFHTDRGDAGTRSIITFDAQARHGSPAEDPAVTVWKQCRSIVNHVRVVDGPAEHDGAWTVTLEPALGEHTERRFVGCLQDLGVDGVTGRLLAVRRVTDGS